MSHTISTTHPRILWTTSMLIKFESILERSNLLATAKVIWQEMVKSFPNITREHVASKLQKWRLKKALQDPKFALRMRRYRKSSESSSSSEDESRSSQSAVRSKGKQTMPNKRRTSKASLTKRLNDAPIMVAPINIDLSVSVDALMQLDNSEASLMTMSEEGVASMLMNLVH